MLELLFFLTKGRLKLINQNKNEWVGQRVSKLRRLCGASFIVLGLVFGGGSIASAGTLSVPQYTQPEDSWWCWATASQMIIKYLTGTKVGLCDLVKDGTGSSSCPRKQSGTNSQANKAMSSNGVKSGSQVTLTWTTLKAQTDARQPIYTRIAWVKGGGHALAVRGYYAGPEGSYIYYNDPANGKFLTKTWKSFVSNSSFSMDKSLVNLKKK